MILEVGKCQVISTIWKEGTLSSNPCLVTMDTCPEAATAPCLSGGNNPGCATAPEDSGRAKAVYLVGLHFVPGRVGGDVSGGVCGGDWGCWLPMVPTPREQMGDSAGTNMPSGSWLPLGTVGKADLTIIP